MDMKNHIPNMIPFPSDAQSSPFFGALASLLLPALGYTEETPYFCGPKGSYCVHCNNDCGSKSNLRKNHNLVYHDYQTFTGVSLGWVWPEDVDSSYQTLPGWHDDWCWPDAFFDYIFGFAGLAWKRLPKGAGKGDIFAAVCASIDAGFPVLMKLGTGPDWHVVTGYDENGTLYGLDSHNHFDHTMRPTRAVVASQSYTDGGLFILPDWFSHVQTAVVITGRAAKTVTFHNILARLVQTLEHPVHGRLERDIMSRLDAVTTENALETAQWLLAKVGFPIEARWHAADSSLIRQTENKAVQDKIFRMIRQYVFDSEHDATHGTCWKIWAQLGVGTATGYALPPNAAELILRPEAQAELKRLFAIVFHNDREVLATLREAMTIL